jgi:poly(A) polymerase
MRADAEAVVRRLRDAGHTAYFAGGCVRDLLWGREPADWDVATDALPERVLELFAAAREVGKSFGVVQVKSGAAWFEVATFRSDSDYSDGRRPDRVTFADARTDAERRDFTINALLLDPASGEVLDFVGGRADLEARVLRAVGDPARRFEEDALRLLRAVRFAAHHELRIEPATWEAMRTHAPRVAQLAAERVHDELVAILTGPAPRRGLELLQASGLLAVLLPEVEAYRGCTQSPEFHPEGDVWEHTLRMLAAMQSPDEALALGVLLHDVAKPATRRVRDGRIHFYGHAERGQEMAAAIMERLRVPSRVQAQVQAMIGQHMRFLDAPRMKPSTLRRFVLQPHFEHVLELHRLDATGASGDLANWELCRRELATLAEHPRPLRPLLGGDELLAMGHAAGPGLGAILRAMVDAQLEGRIQSRDQARAWVQRNFPPQPALDKSKPESPPSAARGD